MSFLSRFQRNKEKPDSYAESPLAHAIRNEVERITQGERFRLTETSRIEMPFSSLEKALGFGAYINWYRIENFFRKNEMAHTMYIQVSNYTGRRVAMETMAHCYRDNHFVSKLKSLVPEFDPLTELAMAIEAVSSPQWSVSITRAVIMVCRNLAYAVTGLFHGGFFVPEGTTLGDMWTVGHNWISREMDKRCADVLLGDNQTMHSEWTFLQAQKIAKNFNELAAAPVLHNTQRARMVFRERDTKESN